MGWGRLIACAAHKCPKEMDRLESLSYAARSKIPAAPMPPPTHMVTMP